MGDATAIHGKIDPPANHADGGPPGAPRSEKLADGGLEDFRATFGFNFFSRAMAPHTRLWQGGVRRLDLGDLGAGARNGMVISEPPEQ